VAGVSSTGCDALSFFVHDVSLSPVVHTRQPLHALHTAVQGKRAAAVLLVIHCRGCRLVMHNPFPSASMFSCTAVLHQTCYHTLPAIGSGTRFMLLRMVQLLPSTQTLVCFCSWLEPSASVVMQLGCASAVAWHNNIQHQLQHCMQLRLLLLCFCCSALAHNMPPGGQHPVAVLADIQPMPCADHFCSRQAHTSTHIISQHGTSMQQRQRKGPAVTMLSGQSITTVYWFAGR
jgi:hypothetical protein